MNDFTVWSFFLCSVFIILFLFVIAISISPWYFGGGGLIIFITSILCTSLLPSIREISERLFKVVVAILTCGVIIFCIGVGLNENTGFLGFSMICIFAFLVSLGVIYSLHTNKDAPHHNSTNTIHGRTILTIYSSYVFPVFEYDTRILQTDTNISNPLKEANIRIWSVYICMAIPYVWSVCACFFMRDTSIGLVCSSIVIIFTVLYTYQLLHKAGIQSQEVCDAISYLDEGSPLYMNTLLDAKWIAARTQLLSHVTLFTHDKSNQEHNPLLDYRRSKKLGDAYDDDDDKSSNSSISKLANEHIIAELSTISTQDYERSYADYVELTHRMPLISLCGLWHPTVSFQNHVYTRREAILKAHELFENSNQWYWRDLRYNLHVAREMIKVVERLQHDHLLLVLAMLRSRGDFSVTLEYLKSIDIWSDDMAMYDAQLDAYMYEREKLEMEKINSKLAKDKSLNERITIDMKHENLMKIRKQEEIEEAIRAKEDALLELADAHTNKEKQRKLELQRELQRLEQEHNKSLEAHQRELELNKKEEEKRFEMHSKEIARRARIAAKRAQQKALADAQMAQAEYDRIHKEHAEITARRAAVQEEAEAIAAKRESAEKRARIKFERQRMAIEAAITDKYQQTALRKSSAYDEYESSLLEMQQKASESAQHLLRKSAQEDEKEQEKLEDAKTANKRKKLAKLMELRDKRAKKREEQLKQKQELAGKTEKQLKLLKKKAEAERVKLEKAMEEEKAAALAKLQKNKHRDVIVEEHDDKAQRLQEEARQLEQRERQAEEKKRELQEKKLAAENEMNQVKRAEEERKFNLQKKQEEIKKRREKLDDAHKQKIKETRKAFLESKKKTEQQFNQEKQQDTRQVEETKRDAMNSLLEEASKQDVCTYRITGRTLTHQPCYKCVTCSLTKKGEGVCLFCKDHCHKGHELQEVPQCEFFCDCGARGNCEKLATDSEKQIEKLHTKQKQEILSADNPITIIISDCKKHDRPYVDPEFPADDRSLFIDPRKPHQPSWKGCEWRRLSQLLQQPNLFVPPLDSDDIKQGKLGNCYFLSACAVLTQKEDALLSAFIENDYNEWGVYGVRFYKNGKMTTVIIDDFVPVRKDPSGRIIPLFAQAREGKEMWVPLIEKAYAKLHHSYQAIEGGWVDAALVDLTGGIPERFSWDNPKIKASLHDGSLWKQLLKFYESGFLIGSGSPMGTSDSEHDASKFGIVQSHAYSVLKLVEVDDLQLIQVRNPWGRFEWKGDWGDKSPLWNTRLKTRVGYIDAEDGAFFMSWTDFCIHFNEVYVCRFFDSVKWPIRGCIYGEWKGITAGGCCKYESVKNNLQYAISVLDDNTEIVVELIQQDSRGEKGKQAGMFELILMELYDNDGMPIQQSQRGRMVANIGAPTQELHIQTTLKAKPKPYTLLCCTFNANVELTYTIKWYATSKIKFQAYSNQGLMTLDTSSGLTDQEIQSTAGGEIQLIQSSSSSRLPKRSAVPVPTKTPAKRVTQQISRSLAIDIAETDKEDKSREMSQDPNYIHSPHWEPNKSTQFEL